MRILKWKVLCSEYEVELSIPKDNRPPFIVSSPEAVNRISQGLNEQGIRHLVDEDSVQIDDGPETLMLYLKDYRDTAYLRSVLDLIGRQTPTFLLCRITIPGHFIASERFQMGVRALEILKAECDQGDIDLSEYDVEICLEPKGSLKLEKSPKDEFSVIV